MMKPTIAICSFVLLAIIVLFVARPSVRSSFFRYISRDNMPIWLSVLLAASAAVGTYIVAPILNQDFEFQKNRSAHLLQTVSELNKLSVDLAVDVRQYNESLFYGKESLTERRGALLDKITELQWRLMDVNVIIDRAGGNVKSVSTLTVKLDRLRSVVMEAKSPEDQELVIASSIEVASASRSCVIELYKAANLDVN